MFGLNHQVQTNAYPSPARLPMVTAAHCRAARLQSVLAPLWGLAEAWHPGSSAWQPRWRSKSRIPALTRRHAPQVSKAADVANQIAAEGIAAIRTVAAFSMEAELALQFRLELNKPWKKFVETALVTGAAYGASFCVIFLARTRAPHPTCFVSCEG